MDNQNFNYIPKPCTFKYTFRIEKEDYDYYQIRRVLGRSLVDNSEYYRLFQDFQIDEYYSNVTNFVVKDLFHRRFIFAGNIQAYLADYSEVRGSFIISFTVLVFGAITNYGSIRETIDYFAEDIERLFSNSLNIRNEGFKVTSSVQEHNNQNLFTQPEARQLDINHFDSLVAKIKVNKILLFIVLFMLILYLIQNYHTTSNTANQKLIDETQLQYLIREEIRNQKIDELLKSKIDTVINKM